MRNLLHANLQRIVHSKAFLFALMAEAAYITLAVLSCWDHCAAGDWYTLEYILTAGYVLLSYLPIPTLILAPLLSLHLGADYGNHTLRNKLIAGHSRKSVYLADLFACAVTAVALDALYLVLSSILCVKPVLEISGRLLRFSAGQMLLWIVVLMLARLAWAAVVKLVVTLLGSQTTASIIVLLLVVTAALITNTGIAEIDYLSRHLTEAGNMGRLNVWRLLLDTLPTGQYYQISRLDTPNLWRMPLLSLLVAVVSTGAGLAFFERKDLK